MNHFFLRKNSVAGSLVSSGFHKIKEKKENNPSLGASYEGASGQSQERNSAELPTAGTFFRKTHVNIFW